MQKSVQDARDYRFPYTDLRFPGMNSGERILFVTRESTILLRVRLLFLVIMAIALFIASQLFITLVSQLMPFIVLFRFVFVLIPICILGVGYYWIHETYRKSVFLITNRRLTKIIYTTPFTWYQFSLGLDEIADTGSYSSSYLEALFGLGYFVARSGAAAVKNFKIVNIAFAADLHNYVNKLLYAFKHHPGKIDSFRPFIPFLKGEKRKAFLEQYPDYATEF